MCHPSSGLRLLEYFGDSSGRLDASFRGRAHFACVLQMILDSFHSPRVCADDSRLTTTVSFVVLHVAASVLVLRMPFAFSNEIGGACRVSWEYRLREGRLCACWNASGAFLGMSSQFRQLCTSSSETQCATCLSANCGGVAPLSWLIHVATARVELPTLLLCTESHVMVVCCSLQTMGCL